MPSAPVLSTLCVVGTKDFGIVVLSIMFSL
jgi:hypothetical protein